ncbi:MAG: tryptophan-rich sensory protein [Candidatus Magasanikbacteria bacterium]|nr:tryptophan-rich sensory protein [Candidatus Magasanikbacteria bacterium]
MNYKRLLISLVLPQLAGLLGSFFTASSIPSWYTTIEKPFFTPPNWLFGPVWISLYILMGISVYLIWQKAEKNKKAKKLVWLFWVHLIFNATWSIVFFGLQNIGLAFLNIIIIWILILVLMWKFEKINKVSAWLLVPYMLWVSYATVLNLAIWFLNK